MARLHITGKHLTWISHDGLEGRGFTGCGKTLHGCHSESFAVILSAAKDLALPAQDKLHEESRPVHFHEHTRFFLRYAQDRLWLLSRKWTRKPLGFNKFITRLSRPLSDITDSRSSAIHAQNDGAYEFFRSL
jgi:hypothetical protein